MNAGVIGLGHMGGSAARTLHAAGHAVVGFDPDTAACHELQAVGVAIAASPEDVFSECDVVLLSLPRSEHVLSVMSPHGPITAMGSGGVVVDLSTISPGAARDASVAATKSGLDYLDAPVLGRPATCGRWSLTVGGAAQPLERARPALETLAASIVPVGDVGAGNAFKLLNNLMVGAINGVTGEILAACERVGIDRTTFVQTVAGSGAASVSNLFLELGPRIAAGDYDPTFALGLLHKDNGLALDMFAEANVTSLIGTAVQDVNERTHELGYAEKDLSAVTLMFEELNRGAQ